MKKYIFFQIGILVSLLIPISQIYGQIVPKFGSVQLTYPINNSVFQQNASGSANISFAGQILKGTYYTPSQLNNFAIQIQQYDYATGSWTNSNSYVYSIVLENCKLPNGDPCSNDPTIDPKTFYLNGNNITTLSKGWYRAAIGYNTNLRATCGTTTKFIPLTAWSTFGVGDVYVVAGQSNVSGFTRDYDNTLVPFESQSANIVGSLPEGGLPTNLLTDSEIPEGSIIYRINKSRSAEGNTAPQGLPLYISQNSTTGDVGFRKFISGKSGQVNVMSIAPNGVDSWAWCRFSKEMVNDVSKKYPVLTFNTAIPNTKVSQWNNGYFDSHLKKTLQMYGGAFGVKAVLWQQGEADTKDMSENSSYSTTNYQSALNNIISLSRTAMGVNTTGLSWVIAKTSYVTSTGTAAQNVGLLTSSPLGTTTSAGYSWSIKADRSASGNLNEKQGNLTNSTNKIFEGPDTDFWGKEFRSEAQRIHFDGYEGTGTNGSSGLKNLGLEWYNKVKVLDNSNNISPLQPNKIKVTKNGNQYTLSLVNPSNGANITTGFFYWIRNELGIGSQEMTSSTYPIATNIPSPYYITCYYQANANSPLTPSQPYYVQQTCSGCRVGTTTTALSRGITLPANGGSGYSLFDNIKDGAFPKINTCLSWVTVSFDESTNTLVATASSNNTGNTRSGTITVVDEVTGATIQTLNLTQSATAGCTQTDLSSLTPTNPSNEWQGYGTMQNNLSIINNALQVGGYTTGNGIGTHAGSGLVRLTYNLAAQYSTFSFRVGRDDEADNCNCGTQKVQFKVYVDDVLQFTSPLMGTTDAAYPHPNQAPQSINVVGANTLRLEVNDGGDNLYGDHADWLDAILYCGSPPSCTVAPPAPTNVSASPSAISAGSSSTLSATCATGAVTWSTGAVGNTITVSPTSSTTYTAKCVSGTCPPSGIVSVGVTVSTGSCSVVTNGLVMGTWNINSQSYPLVARFFNGQYWLTQRNGTNPDNFVVRGSQMLQRSDVSLVNGSYSGLIACFAWQYSNNGGLAGPTNFSTPSGYTLYYSQDGTPYYQVSGVQPSCTNTDLGNGWSYASAAINPPPKVNAKQDGTTPIKINTTSYAKGIGTHAFSEIIYTLGNHSFTNFKASVGRDFASYGCNCGGQTVVFKVYDNTTGTLIGGPVIKGINQNATDMTVPISGVSSLKLVVEDGGDNNWGDWADWANARVECPNNNLRQGVEQMLQEETIQGLEIFPNPTNDKLTVKFSLTESSKVSFDIVDMQGRMLAGGVPQTYQYKGEAGIHTFIIDVSKLNVGSYLLRGVLGTKLEVKKFVVER
jgi:NPCBM/NEW2 domain/Secretion system C-terminal sorting domain/Carbohydrate esterase, sialic acid-specific acetylesterase